jgi:hypothetical protein
MKFVLRILALLLVLGAIITWAVLGANRGWTRTSEPVKTVDQVTGIEGIEYHKKFVPGMDFLGAVLLAGLVIGGASFLFRNQPTKQTQQ